MGQKEEKKQKAAEQIVGELISKQRLQKDQRQVAGTPSEMPAPPEVPPAPPKKPASKEKES